MPSGCKILLKARPTPEQLADRLREPLPDGLELYLNGPRGAFGGALSSYLGAEATSDGEPSFSTPKRAGTAVERAHRQHEVRYERMLED